MKKLFTLATLALSFSTFAQVPWATHGEWIENGSFECWENEGDPTMEPCNWSSLKTATPSTLASAAPDGSVSRDNGYGGGYCIKLKAQEYNIGATTIVANGIVTTGRVYASYDPEEGYVFTNPNNEDWNMPQTHHPDSLIGYYKFSPSSGDKAKIELTIHTDDDSDGNASNGIAQMPLMSTSTSNIIAKARIDFVSAQSTWKRFSTPINYTTTTVIPDYGLFICSAGDSTQAVDQTTLWVDEMDYIYNTLSIEENDSEFLDFNLINGNELSINVLNSETYSLEIYNTAGKLVLSRSKLTGNQFILPKSVSNGIFIVKLSTEKSFHTKKYFIK